MRAALAATLLIVNIINIYTEEVETTSETILEKLYDQKEHLIQQINDAIKDEDQILKKNNKTLAYVNLQHIKELYEELLKKDGIDPQGGSIIRRSTNQTGAVAARRNKEKKMFKFFDFMPVSSKKKKHKEEEKELDRILMQGKIDEWLLNRELEKKKIKNYMDRMHVSKPEKCPRHGVSRKSKSLRTRRSEKKKKRKRRGRNKGGKLYPCCRKCCKRSYMGCL